MTNDLFDVARKFLHTFYFDQMYGFFLTYTLFGYCFLLKMDTFRVMLDACTTTYDIPRKKKIDILKMGYMYISVSTKI